MKFTKSLLAGLIASTAMLGGMANAAEMETYDIKLKASIPSDEFHVRPVEMGWLEQEQEMEFDIGTKRLKAIEKMFQYKNSAGAIQAQLDPATVSDNNPILFNGTQNIPLSVSFNNTVISATTAETVVTEADAKTGGRANLKIAMKENTPLTLNTYAGEYTGTVSVIFEPVVVVTP